MFCAASVLAFETVFFGAYTRRLIQGEKGWLVRSRIHRKDNKTLLESHCSGRSLACLAASHTAQSCCSFLTWFILINLKERQHRSRLDIFSYMVLTVSRGTGKLGGTFIEGPLLLKAQHLEFKNTFSKKYQRFLVLSCRGALFACDDLKRSMMQCHELLAAQARQIIFF